jgi:hypothetical protein
VSLVRPTTLLAVATVLALPVLAQAQDNKVDVQVLVAQVSTKGTEVAPELKAMAADFKRNGLAFTSFKLVSKEALKLKLNETGTVKLPKGLAKVTLQKLAGAKASVKVEPPGIVLEMTPGGEAYIGAGANGPDQLYLAVKR